MKRISILIVIVIILLCNQSIALGLSNRVLCSCGWCGYHPKRSVRERHVSTKNKDWHEVTIYYNSYCPDCGALFSTVYDYDEYRESHTFVNGKCKVCEWPEPQKASDNKTNNNNTNTNNNNTNTNNNNTNNNSNNRKNELRERNMLLGEKAIGRTIKVVYEVNLFEESSANSYSYGKMPIGSTATILDYKKNSVTSAFFLVRYNNTNGWVTVSNVEVTNGGSLPSSGCTHIGKWVTTVSKASNARSGPGVQYQQINIVPPNTQFKVYDDIPFTVSAAAPIVTPTATPTIAPTGKPVNPSNFNDVAVPSDSFTFKKVWQGDSEKTIDFTLYKADGTVYHHGFDKKIVSNREWRYNAWFSAPAACYVIEKPIPGYQTKYVNVGVYAQITDRCCDGGTIINKKIPKTGDTADLALWAGLMLAGIAGLTTLVLVKKRRKAEK